MKKTNDEQKRKRGRPPKGTPRVFPTPVVVHLDQDQWEALSKRAEENFRTPARQAQAILADQLAVDFSPTNKED